MRGMIWAMAVSATQPEPPPATGVGGGEPTVESAPLTPADAPAPAPSAPPAPGRYLIVEDDRERRPVPLGAPVVHLGRGMSADVVLDHHSVSRRHALIVQRGRRTFILDDRSLNGVLVNGRPVSEAELHHEDVLVLGRVVLRYLEL